VRVFNIDRALSDPRMLGAALGDSASWQTWLAVLRASFGLPLDEQQQQVFASVAGSRAPPTQRVRELWAVIGRRGGKSRIAAALAVYFAAFFEHKLARGERGMVLVIAGSLEQARTVFGYIKGFFDAAPTLAREVVSSTASEIILRNRHHGRCAQQFFQNSARSHLGRLYL
jgi:phage terminase large subunit-like protein